MVIYFGSYICSTTLGNWYNSTVFADYFGGSASLANSAELNIETEPVPEPTTIFGSALALGVGGWLKRKKSSQGNKTTPQD